MKDMLWDSKTHLKLLGLSLLELGFHRHVLQVDPMG